MSDPPIVNAARLRFFLTSEFSEAEIIRALDVTKEVLAEIGLKDLNAAGSG